MTGSLRAASRNTSVLLACARLLPAAADLDLFRELDALPHFSPDVDDDRLPAAVTALHARLAAADAVLVSSPEYAHGVPGSFKNALDWLVGVGLGRRPVGLINASPLSTHAHAHLAEILATMDGVLARDAVLVLPFAPRDLDPATILADPALTAPLQRCVDALVAAGREWRATRP